MPNVYAIGIDFGTSNSCVALATYFDRGDGTLDPDPLRRPEALEFDMRQTVPTVVFLGDGGAMPPQFGELAEEQAAHYPELTRQGFKLHLSDARHGPEAFALSQQFLTYLHDRVAEVIPLDSRQSSDRVETIVGHPVQWSADQREETRRAAQEAGFPNVRLEEESMAALYSHLCDSERQFQPKPGSRILMMDMGGGTTDFAFLQLGMTADNRPVSIPVDPSGSVPTWGDGRRSYGGRDLDRLILLHLSRDWDPAMVERNLPWLMREVRRFKEEFSQQISTGVNRHDGVWVVDQNVIPVSLTLQEFETLAREYMDHLEILLRGALEEARLAPRQVTYLVLTGGHSRWYFVSDTVRRVLPHLSEESHTILRHPQPEQSVARGLAYDPLVRSNRRGVMAPVRRAAHAVWVSVPNGSIGQAGDGGSWDEPVVLVPRGQTLPFQSRTPLRLKVEQLATDAREAVVRIRFYSGQRKLPLAERVGRFERGFLEQLNRKLANRLPFFKASASDEFEVLVACQVDDHELITAEVLITRYVNGKPTEVQRQKMKLDTALG